MLRLTVERVRSLARCAGLVMGAHLLAAGPASTRDFTAGFFLDELEDSQHFAYLSGIVEGLAYSRFKADGDQIEGMACVYGWFYDDPEVTLRIYTAFDKFRDHTPGAIMGAMIERKCPR